MIKRTLGGLASVIPDISMKQIRHAVVNEPPAKQLHRAKNRCMNVMCLPLLLKS